MMHALAGCGRRNVRDKEAVLDIVYDNRSTVTRDIYSAKGRLSQSPAWRTVRENKLYLFHLQSKQGL
jgi:hypothetical protein